MFAAQFMSLRFVLLVEMQNLNSSDFTVTDHVLHTWSTWFSTAVKYLLSEIALFVLIFSGSMGKHSRYKLNKHVPYAHRLHQLHKAASGLTVCLNEPL